MLNKIDSIVILSCPFCNEFPIIEKVSTSWMPICSNIDCIAGYDGAYEKSKKDAIIRWNTRVT